MTETASARVFTLPRRRHKWNGERATSHPIPPPHAAITRRRGVKRLARVLSATVRVLQKF
jgi:hypothetical protein